LYSFEGKIVSNHIRQIERSAIKISKIFITMKLLH